MNRKPNFIVLYPDSLGANAIRHYGCQAAYTPQIDRLAETGVDFWNCTSQSPVCMPSRASLITGKYVSAHGVYDNNLVEYPAGHLTFQQRLKQEGYRTAYLGKTHSINQSDWDEVFDLYPDYNAYLREQGIATVYPERFPLAQLNAGFSSIPAEHFSEVVLGNLAVDYLIRSGRHDNPFLLFISFEAPHSPWALPEGYRHWYRPDEIDLLPIPPDDRLNKPLRLAYHRKRSSLAATDDQLRHVIGIYHALASIVDEQIGRIVDALDHSGQQDDTIIVFTSDHGDHLGNHRTMGKCLSLEEDLIRVPLIIKGPAFPNHSSRVLVESIDIFPTLIELAGLDRPSGLHGRSLAPLLESETAPWSRTHCFSEEHYDPYPGQISVRNETHKLVISSDGFEEIYDLQQDPHEWYNLAGRPDSESIVSELKDAIIQFGFRHIDKTHQASSNWVQEFMAPDSQKY